MKKRIDINCDLGESYGHFRVGNDAEIMPHITSANIACGFHAGDPVTMANTVELAKKHKVAVGAHPGNPDLLGFGRREMKLTPEELRDYFIYQIGALQAFAEASNIRLQHIKPHGALYDVVARDETASNAIVEAVHSLDKQLIIFTPPKSIMARIAAETGQRVAFEAFGDRAYNPDGTLVSRSKPNSVIQNPKIVAERVIKMINHGSVIGYDNKTVRLGEIHTVCVHGDTPAAVELAKNLKTALLRAGIEIKPVGSFL